MTVSTQQASVTIEGDGANTTFAFDFELPYQADGSTPAVALYYTDADGATSSVGYTSITGVGSATGGSLQYTLSGDPIVAGTFLTIQRDLALIQPDEFEDQSFRASGVEAMGDTIVMELQQLQDQINRTVRFGPGPLVADTGSPLQARGGYLFADGATGQPEWIADPIVVTAGSTVTVASVALLRLVTGLPVSIQTESYLANGSPKSAGLYILDPADTTSADNGADILVTANNGRYKLVWDGAFNFLQAGAVGDGDIASATLNAAAINRFCVIARRDSDAGKGFVLHVPPGHYKWNGALTGLNWLSGIKKLVIDGYGSEWTNTNPASDRSWPLAAQGTVNASTTTYKGFGAGVPMSILINNTTVGATSFTTTTHADAGKFDVGLPVLLASVDLQWLGFPINTDHLEFHTVVSANATTGVVVVDTPIIYQHLTTYPDGGRSDGYACGKGRAWLLTTPVLMVDPATGSNANILCPWDVEQKYLGLKINPAVNPNATYISIDGKDIQFIDCIMPGISPTIAGKVVFRNCTVIAQSEPDKLVERVVLDNCNFPHGLVFQSSSISHVEVIGGYYSSFSPGSAKYVTITNPNFDNILFSSVYGPARSCIIHGGTIRSASGQFYGLTSNPERQIDGVSILYAAGVISVLKDASLVYWGLVPGDQLNLCGPATVFSGTAGTGVVTAARENATHVLFDISWPWANLGAAPFTNDGKLRVWRVGDIQVYGTSGCDDIRNMAEATKRGLQPSEFTGGQMVNFNTSTGAMNGAYGALTGFNVDVQQKSATAAKTIVFSFQCWPDATLAVPPGYAAIKNLVITIDLSTKGARALTMLGFLGVLGSDSVVFDGSPVTELPMGYVIVNGGCTYSHNITLPGTSATIPVVDVSMIADGGIYGSPLIRNLDATVNPVTNVTGLVPS